nr:hypothetical protein [Bacteroides intestinalis]
MENEWINYRVLESKDHIGNTIMNDSGEIGRLTFTCYLQRKYSTISNFNGNYYVAIREGDTTKVSPIFPEIVEILRELPQF